MPYDAKRLFEENRALHAQLASCKNEVNEALDRNNKVHAELTAARQRITALEEAIQNEPELPGEIPHEMFETIKTLDRQGMEEYCRIIVRKTKEGILRNAQPTQTKT